MRVCKVELYFVDFDDVGDDAKYLIEGARYPNRCIAPTVLRMNWKDIGEWSDEHPLNHSDTCQAAISQLFKE